MNMITKLRPAPIKYRPLGKTPEEVVYKTGLTFFDDLNTNIFIMLRTKRPHERCVMITRPEKIKRDGKNIPSLYIWRILSQPKNCGLGSAMIDFAKFYSKQNNYLGNIHLNANYGYTPYSIPHIFYRKQGFNTKYDYINKKMDDFIKSNTPATYKDFDNIEMYYPPIKSPEKKWQTILRKLFTNKSI